MTYVAKEEIGRGGFGIVEKVDGDDGFEYARKTLVVPPQLDKPSVTRRFYREVKYQSVINHKNVVHIFEFDLDVDPPWFVMPLAVCSLSDEMRTDRTLGGDPKAALFDVLNGLEEIHRLGYCHRDLKPGNILKFVLDNGDETYALSDFGLMAVGEDASSTLTPTGVGGGTPLYQAPECAINFRRATARSDIYSFGALLHDIFAPNPKRLPHEELTALGDIGAVIEKCTKRNAHRRYQNVGDLREALYSALGTFEFEFESHEEEEVVGLLTNETVFPNADQWDRIFDFLDSNVENFNAVSNVIRALRREHIEQLAEDDLDLMSSLGIMFGDFCRKHQFSFGYCDVLASKAQLFYDLGEIALKANVAIAMLVLGTSHNRWFVEEKFMQMAGVSIDLNLANRIVVEMGVLGIDFPAQFNHLELSIRAQSGQLHPAIREQIF